MAQLYEKLLQYSKSETYPFHMPGHKRRFGEDSAIPYQMDITEIAGFDNLNAPEPGGVIWEMQEQARQFYGTGGTFFLVNGSTGGLLAAIAACAGLQDEILLARNCHMSVYRTVGLLGLKPHYLYPEYCAEYGIFGDLRVDVVAEALKRYPESRCVVVTSPTYEGVILDIRKISDLVHEAGKWLIVDEAHGAHLPFLRAVDGGEEQAPERAAAEIWDFSCSALYQGADLVVQSLHKTLPSLTQTALLQVSQQTVERDTQLLAKIAESVRTVQSSSPSYLLTASIGECMSWCRSDEGRRKFDEYQTKIRKEREAYRQLQSIHLVEGSDLKAYRYDLGKLVFAVNGQNGNGMELMQRLRERDSLECEMAADQYVLAMTSVCDSDEGLRRLRRAIFALDAELSRAAAVSEQGTAAADPAIYGGRQRAVLGIREAAAQKSTWVKLSQLQKERNGSYISGGYVLCYPPGIPLLTPGEQITSELVEQLVSALEHNLPLQGVRNAAILVIQ